MLSRTLRLSTTALRVIRTPAVGPRRALPLRTASTTAQAFNHEKTAQRQLDQGAQLLNEGNFEGAARAFEASLQVRESSTGYFNLAVTRRYQDRTDEAIAAFEKSIELEPSADAYSNLAAILIMRSPGKPDEALKLFRKAVEHSPEDPELRYNLAVVLEACDKLDESLKEYTLASERGVERAAQGVRNVGGA